MMFDGHATEDSFRREVRNGWTEDRSEQIEKREFGGDGFDIALDKVADPERRLGTADLAFFTAPAVRAGARAS